MYLTGNGDVTHQECRSSPGVHIVYTGWFSIQLKICAFHVVKDRRRLNPIQAGGNPKCHEILKKNFDFDFTPLTVILHILSIPILIRCCHSNLLFTVCQVISGIEKTKNLNYFQDNYLIKLKFGGEGYF